MSGSNEPIPGDNPNFNGMVLRFRMRTVPDEERSRLEGREVTRQVEWVRIHAAGDKANIIDREVTDRERAHPRYLAWKHGRAHGTPLTEWERTREPDMAEALADAGVYCLEDLANVSDAHVHGDYQLRAAARDFLAKRTAEATARAHDDRDATIAELKAQVAQLLADRKGAK